MGGSAALATPIFCSYSSTTINQQHFFSNIYTIRNSQGEKRVCEPLVGMELQRCQVDS